MREGFAERVRNALDSISNELISGEVSGRPKIGLILGSGLGEFAEGLEGIEIPYSEIEGFPTLTVEGHRGLLKVGKSAAVLSGRCHYYEGYSLDEVVLPVFLLHGLGVKTLIITNAAGGINREFAPGDLVLIRDHINLLGMNPLRGPNPGALGPRFPDMSEAYPQSLRKLAREAWRKVGTSKLKQGIYAALPGPSYETPAEIRMAERMGADLVGMSTVPEVIAANFLGLRVLGISCVTNMAAGILDRPLSHKEVVETGRKVQPVFKGLLDGLLELLAVNDE